jgi:hypothetical protein
MLRFGAEIAGREILMLRFEVLFLIVCRVLAIAEPEVWHFR